MESARTIQYIRELKAAGISQEQAEAQVIALENALTDLATKSELLAVKDELNNKIDKLATKEELKSVRDELKADIKDVRAEIKEVVNNLKAEIKDATNNLKWFVVYVVAGTAIGAFVLPVSVSVVTDAISKWLGK